MKTIAKNVTASQISNAAPAPLPPPPAPPSPVVTTMSDAAVTECSALLDQVLALVGDQASLNADQIRRSTKMRKGGAEVIPMIVALCQQHGITQVGSLTIAEMSSELSRGDALAQVGVQSGLVQKKVKDGAMAARGRSWQIATTLYTTLKRMAADDAQLALGLAAIASFFQTKRTKGKVRQNKKVSAQKKLAKQAGVTAQPATTTPGPSPSATAPAAPHAPVNGADVAPATATSNGAAVATTSPAVLNGAPH
jgi:hypothetical protein